MKAKILLIERRQDLIDPLVDSLTPEEFSIHVEENPVDIIKTILAEKPDLIILGQILSGEGHMTICTDIRAIHSINTIPIIIISNDNDEISNNITTLNAGADDYITTPVDMKELVARIKGLLRRSEQTNTAQILRSNSIELDLDRWTASVEGENVILTAKEFRLLQELMEAKGRVLTRDALLQRVWGYDEELDISTRTVDIHLSRLRRKLGRASNQILTIRNVGYRMDFSSAWVAQPAYSHSRHSHNSH